MRASGRAPSHAKALKDFAEAQNQALAWMKANPSGVATILENSFQLPPFTHDVHWWYESSFVPEPAGAHVHHH